MMEVWIWLWFRLVLGIVVSWGLFPVNLGRCFDVGFYELWLSKVIFGIMRAGVFNGLILELDGVNAQF